jgi:von Hippel-Lindau disease tumor suppressor protein
VTAPIDFAMAPQRGLLKLDGGRCAIVLHYTASWTKSYPPGVYDASGKKIFRLDRDLLIDDSGHEYYFDNKWDRVSKDGGIVMNYHFNKRQWEWVEGVPMNTSPILADRVDKESIRRIYKDDGRALKTPEQGDYPILRFENGKYLNEFGEPVYSLYGHLPEWAQIILLHRYYEQVYLSDAIVEIDARRTVAADLFANSNSLAVDVFNWGADYGPSRKKTIVYFTELEGEIFVLNEGQIRQVKNKWLNLNEKPLLGSGSTVKIPEASFYLSKRKAKKRGVTDIGSKSVVLEIKARPEHSAEFLSAITQYVADDREEAVFEETESISVETAGSACSMLHDLKSTRSKIKTSVRFVNNRENPVHVYWIDPKSEEIFYRTLAKGESHNQSTTLTHLWLVRDENGSCLGVFEPTENGSEAVLF